MRIDQGLMTTQTVDRVRRFGKKFFCPLCRSERTMRVSSRLSGLNYLQIFITSSCLVALLWPVMGAKGLFLFFAVWSLFEFVRRLIFKKNIPCPHCGFDATWYKKDVKVARKIVEDFWKDKNKDKDPEQALKDEQEVLSTIASQNSIAQNDEAYR